MRVRTRNERAVVRGEASVIEPDGAGRDSRALFVPDDVVIDPPLFDVLSKLDPPLRLRAPDGAELDWGLTTTDTQEHQLADAHFFDVSTPSKRRHAERILLLRTEKSTDGWVSRRLNRPLSRFFSRWFLKAGLSPNVASALSLAIGVCCGVAAAQPGGVWLAVTGVLFQFASMFDGVDGEMARVTLRDSKVGAAIDSLVDNMTYLATLVGFGVGWVREGITELELWALGTVSLSVAFTLLAVFLFLRKHAPDMSFVFFDSSVRRAAHESDSASMRAIDLFFRATRRDLLALILMFVSFLGSRFLIVCLIGFGVLVADYLLFYHRSALVRAAGLLRAEQRA